MAARVLDDGGQVAVAGDPPLSAAARLRYPLDVTKEARP
jgi:hypothetical protein